MGYVWMIKLIVIVQFLLSLEMFGVMGIWSRGLFSWFCIRFYVTVEMLEITGLSKNSEMFTVDSLYYLGFSGKISWSLDV